MEEKHIQIGQATICYVESGPGGTVDAAGDGEAPRGLTILYVHGNLGSYKWFTRVMEIRGARTIALDMPNFGRSSHIEAHSIAVYSRHVVEFIQAVAAAPVLLVGHSLGGAVAMGVATAEPDLVRGLMLVDSAPVEGLVTPDSYHPVIEQYRQNEAVLRPALKGMVPTLADERFFDELVADARRMKGEAYVGHAVELGKADFSTSAGNYSRPMVFLRGENDPLITADMAQRTAAAFGGEVWEQESVGHSIMAEDPARFRGLVETFARSL